MNLETWKRAQNLQVASLAEGAFVGRLDDFMFDLETHQIYGWRLKGSGMFAKPGGVPADELVLVGRDLALIRSEEAVEWSGGRITVVDGRAWASAYRGTQAVSRRGGGPRHRQPPGPSPRASQAMAVSVTIFAKAAHKSPGYA